MSHSPSRRGLLRAAAAVAMLVMGASCDATGPDPVRVGDLSVGATATGLDQLLGFTVEVDSSPPRTAAVGVNAILHALRAGKHTLTVAGIPDNCVLEGNNPRVVDVPADDVTPIRLSFTCVARTGIVEITIATKGMDGPGGYGVEVDGGSARGVPANGTVALDIVGGGSRLLKLMGLSPNCAADDGIERSVSVQTGTMTRDTVRVSFQLTCTALTGLLEITSATTGDDPDPTGYLVQVDGRAPFRIVANGLTTQIVDGGTHVLTLSEIASNCALQGPGDNTRTVVVHVGGQSRDTVRTSFAATCTPAEKIAFARWTWDYYYATSEIFVVYADGANPLRLAAGSNPAWSPDGKRIIYTRSMCDWYECSFAGLGIINADGTGARNLTLSSDDWARWSPDGSKLTFIRSGQLWIVNADGSSEKRIAMDGVANILSPAWSPNGNTIAFGCEVVASWRDICVVNTDGSGLQRLTNDPWRDLSPTWSADGTRLAFSTNRDDARGDDHIATIRADGSGFVKLLAGFDPVWSPSGNRIAFTTGIQGTLASHDIVSMNPDGSDVVGVSFASAPSWSRDGTKMVFIGATDAGLYIVNANGTGRVRLTNNANDDAPAWRP